MQESAMSTPRHDYFAAVEADWDLLALAGLRASLLAAYQALGEKADPLRDPTFGTPNGPMVTGVMRWMYVDHFLARGCQLGWLPGITAHWLHLGDGGVSALELRGRHTSLMAFHLKFPDASIRDSRLRFDKRFTNQMNPGFPQWELDADPENGDLGGVAAPLINLVLVHGGRRAEFAYLRAYHDPEDLHRFLPMSGNIIEQARLAPASDEELVEESVPTLKVGTAIQRERTLAHAAAGNLP